MSKQFAPTTPRTFLLAAKISGRLLGRGIAPWLIALSSVFIAIVLSSAAVSYSGETPMIFFVLAVIVAAGRGFGPGLMATFLSLWAVQTMFRGSVSIPLATQSIGLLFVVIALVVNLVFHELHRKNEELLKKNRALSHAKVVIESVNQDLVDRAESLAQANTLLSEERRTLVRAHEQLRLLGHDLAENIRVPLTKISATTDTLAQSDAARVDVTLARISSLIKSEVRRVDTLASDFARVC